MSLWCHNCRRRHTHAVLASPPVSNPGPLGAAMLKLADMPCVRRPLLVACSAMLGLLLFAAPAISQSNAAFTIQPYLQYLSSSSVSVRFETRVPSKPIVELSSSPADKRQVPDAEARFHSIHVDGLKAATTYTYLVRTADATSSPATFTTAPVDPAQAIHFIVYGDSRSGDAVHAAIVRAIESQPVDFLVNTGDVVVTGTDSDGWYSFFAIEAGLMRTHCLFCTIGNHELERGSTRVNYVRFFGPSDSGSGPSYFSFRWGSSQFFSLDAMDPWDGEQYRWFRAELEKYDSDPSIAHRFVSVHHSPFSSGPHGGSKALLKARVPALLRQHHVELIFAGHDHLYERGEVDGLKYIITGGAGAPLYLVTGAAPGSEKAISTHHFVEVDIQADVVKIRARGLAGNTLDDCQYRTGSRWLCEGQPAPAAAAASAPTAQPAAARTEPPAPRSHCGCGALGAQNGAHGAASFASLVAIAALRRKRRLP